MLMDQINSAAATLRKKKYKKPIRVRIHPLDMQVIQRRYNPEPSPEQIEALMGYPLEIDCAVRRGHPVTEYKK